MRILLITCLLLAGCTSSPPAEVEDVTIKGESVGDPVQPDLAPENMTWSRFEETRTFTVSQAQFPFMSVYLLDESCIEFPGDRLAIVQNVTIEATWDAQSALAQQMRIIFAAERTAEAAGASPLSLKVEAMEVGTELRLSVEPVDGAANEQDVQVEFSFDYLGTDQVAPGPSYRC